MHFVVVTEIREDPTGVADEKSLFNLVGQDRLTKRGKPGQLAFVAASDEAQRHRHHLVGIAQTVDRPPRKRTLFAAVDRGYRPVGKVPVAVVDRIPASVRGDNERSVPLCKKQRRQGMSFVVVVEVKMGVVTEAAGSLEFVDFEDVVNLGGFVAQNLINHGAARTLLQILAGFLANPA